MSSPARDRGLFLLAVVAASLPLWSVKYLPMVDLPQHAAQIALWQTASEPNPDFARTYEINWFTPYLLGYLLTGFLARFTTILVALKLVITASVIGFAAALAWLLRVTGRDHAWAITGIPLAFGYAFYWGFFSFLVAMPLVFVYLVLVARHTEKPTRGTGLALALATLGLFFAHVMIFALAGLAASGWIALRATRPRDALAGLLPLVLPLPFVALWIQRTAANDSFPKEPIEFGLAPWSRLAELPGTLLGEGRDPEAWMAGALLLALVLAGFRPARERWRWAPLVAALGLFLFLPYFMFSIRYLYARFAAFLIPFLLLATRERSGEGPVRPGLLIAGVTGVTVLWMAVLTARFRAFDRDARGFDRVISAVVPGKSLVSVSYYPVHEAIPMRVPFVHFAAWNQVERGGAIGYSFAATYPMLVRFRPGMAPKMTRMLEVMPRRFDWATDGDFDYYLVRTPPETAAALFEQAPQRVTRIAQDGNWWLYRRRATP